MTVDPRVLDLLVRYEALAGSGQPVTPEGLCADCPELLEEVRRRIEGLGALDDLLEGPAGKTVIQGGPPGQAPAGAGGEAELVGQRYRVVQFHARGGLGEVHVAQDGELGRRVALKRLQPQHAADPDSRRRFLREAELTARLEHPGVVPVHGLVLDAGGQPCYAMRFIEGQSLQQAIAEFHGRERGLDPGERALALRQLLGRFVAVCNTVAFAHSRGVLHRDLKPANVMLGPYGETLVVDWGLAKPLGQTEEAAPGGAGAKEPGAAGGTQPGQAMGTPAYMSPEQAAGRWGEVGPASDVYALGAILYCLLTGRPPFTGESEWEIMQKVGRGELAPPRQVKRDVPVGLAAICLKAMASKPQDRYATALELAAEVERWLADDPVSCWREPWRARLQRWARRHRTVVVGGGAVLGVALLFFAVLAGVLYLKNAELAAEQGKTKVALSAESRRREQARQALDEMSSALVDDLLAKQEKLSEAHRSYLQKALASYLEFAADTGEDEASRAGVAGAFLRVGDIHHRLGEAAKAAASYEEARGRFEQLAAQAPEQPDYRLKMALCLNNRANLLSHQGRLDEALGLYRDSLALRERLASDFPDRPAYRLDLGRSHYNLGLTLDRAGRPREGEAALRRSLAVLRPLADDHPNFEHHFSLAASHGALGYLLARQGEHKPAEEAYRHQLDVLGKLARTSSDPKARQFQANTFMNLGELLRTTGQLQPAREALQASVATLVKLCAEFPAVPSYRDELAAAHSTVAFVLEAEGRDQDALAADRQALALSQQLADAHPGNTTYRSRLAGSCSKVGYLLSKRGDRRVEAESFYDRALGLYGKLVDERPKAPEFRQGKAQAHHNLGLLHTTSGRYDRAEKAYRAALALRQNLADDTPGRPLYRQQLAHTLMNLGVVLGARKRYDEAETCHRKALKLQEALAAAHPRVVDYAVELGGTCSNLADVLRERDRPQQALPEYDRAVRTLQAVLARQGRHPQAQQFLREAFLGRAAAYAQLGRTAEAAQDMGRALEAARAPRSAPPGR
jgi:serine/threonine-protein kinase